MPLAKGKKARTPKGFQENIKTMKKAGYGKKRAVGTAYGEADLAIDKAKKKKVKHMDIKADEKLIKKMIKELVKAEALKANKKKK